MARGFTGGHWESYRVNLLDVHGRFVRELRMLSGSLEWSMFTEVTGSGRVVVEESDEGFDWLSAQLQIVYEAGKGDDRIIQSLMRGIPSAQPESRGGFVEVTFNDPGVILLEDEMPSAYSAIAGVNVIGKVKELLGGLGWEFDIEPSNEVVKTSMSWETGTPRLGIINDLLESVNYHRLRVSGTGVFYSSKVLSVDDSTVHDFDPADPNLSIVAQDVSNSRDFFSIPNRMILVSTTDGEAEPFVSVVENRDPFSPHSIENRGRVVSRTDRDVEASSQDVLDSIAISRLQAASQVTWRQTLKHLWVDLTIGDSVRGVDGQIATVVEMRQELKAGELSETVVRRMDRLYSVEGGVIRGSF